MTRDKLHTHLLLILAMRDTVKGKARKIMTLIDQYEGIRLLNASGVTPVEKSHLLTLEKLL